MQLPSDAARFLPLVKNIAVQVREAIVPDVDLEQLVSWGSHGLAEAFSRYRTRQGLTLRTYLTYKIRGTIYESLAGHSWPSTEARAQYLFAKKSNEVLLHFHLSAEGTIKRSIKAEEEKELHLLSLLAVVALLILGTGNVPELKNSMKILDVRQKDFLRHYYEQDLAMEATAEKIGLSGPVAFRFHLQILEKLARYLSRNRELNV